MSALVFILLFVVIGPTASFLEYNVIQKSVNFKLYTKTNPDNPIPLSVSESLDDKIKTDIPWKFFIHGWTTSPSVSPWYTLNKNNYFQIGEYNIVFVDWSKPANQTYLESIINTRSCGRYFGEFILHLKNNGVPLSQIHLLGHSLGSHMAGFAGKYVFNVTDEKIGRITATDPARPLWETPFLLPSEQRLSKLDTEFLDVIHTDAGSYGMAAAIGHVDFFPNGGRRFQPGCENTGDENCSHARSVYFYAESIVSNKFIARKSYSYEDYLKNKYLDDTKAIFGEKVDHKLRGKYYFTTNSAPPFAQGEK